MSEDLGCLICLYLELDDVRFKYYLFIEFRFCFDFFFLMLYFSCCCFFLIFIFYLFSVFILYF